MNIHQAERIVLEKMREKGREDTLVSFTLDRDHHFCLRHSDYSPSIKTERKIYCSGSVNSSKSYVGKTWREVVTACLIGEGLA